jgi:hypothetical protein
MNTQQAHLLGEKVMGLIDICAEYEARFRKGNPAHDSPELAWQLSAQIFEQQRQIAGLLDQEAITATNVSVTGWDLFSQYMHMRIAVDMMKAVAYLKIECLKVELEPENALRKKMMKTYQHAISRLLDPKAVRERTI